jgi:Ca-activated chloride channel family protein
MEKNTVRLVERFQWPLALALWCLLVSFYYEFPVRPRPRDLKLTTGPATSKTAVGQNAAALLIFALLASNAFSTRSLAAESTPEPPAPPPIARIVSRLSTSSQPTARDWAELGRETVTWGSKLQSSQQPVAEGPVRDALSAVDLGSKLDPKTADWPKLREELEALLKKPDDQEQQKQDQQKQDDQKQNQNQDQQQQDDQQKQDAEQNQGNESEQQKDPSQSQKSEDQKEQKQSEADPKDEQQKEDSALGDMKDREQPPSPPPTEDTQQVGGARKNEKGEETPIDPNLALPLQKLDQLRNQDSPAELFKLLEGEKDNTPRKKTKDW